LPALLVLPALLLLPAVAALPPVDDEPPLAELPAPPELLPSESLPPQATTPKAKQKLIGRQARRATRARFFMSILAKTPHYQRATSSYATRGHNSSQENWESRRARGWQRSRRLAQLAQPRVAQGAVTP
jgi:hypothetical protein